MQRIQRYKSSIDSSDSPGPVVHKYENTVLGVTSFGHLNGSFLSIAQGFTKVLSFPKWISNHPGIKLPIC